MCAADPTISGTDRLHTAQCLKSYRRCVTPQALVLQPAGGASSHPPPKEHASKASASRWRRLCLHHCKPIPLLACQPSSPQPRAQTRPTGLVGCHSHSHKGCRRPCPGGWQGWCLAPGPWGYTQTLDRPLYAQSRRQEKQVCAPPCACVACIHSSTPPPATTMPGCVLDAIQQETCSTHTQLYVAVNGSLAGAAPAVRPRQQQGC